MKGSGKVRCKGRMAGRRMRWIIVGRPSSDEVLDGTWRDWLMRLVLLESAAELGVTQCSIWWVRGSARRCFPGL